MVARLTTEDRKEATRFLKENLADGRRYVYTAVLAGIGGVLCTVAQAFAFATAVHRMVVEGAAFGEVSGWLWVFGAAVALKAVFSYGVERLGSGGALAVQRGLRRRILGRMFSEDATGRPPAAPTATALIEQVDKLEGYYARYLPLMYLAVLAPLVMLLFVFPVSWVAGLILLFSAPLIPVHMALVGMGAEDASRRQFEALRHLSGYFLDRLQGLQTLKRMGYADREPANIAAASDELQSRTMRVLRVAFLSSTVLEFFATFSIAIAATYIGLGLLGWLGFGFGTDGITLQAGLFLLLLAPVYFQPLRSFAAAYHDRADALAAAQDLIPLVGASELETASGGAVPMPGSAIPGIGAIQLRGATVRYAGRRLAALESVDLDISAGSRISVTGPSGSGKSTLLAVVSGQVPVTGGTVLVNGRPLEEYEPGALRALTSWVGQRPYLFPDTIAENIALGQPEKTWAEVEEAARRARVTEFAAGLPDGLDTVIGERGTGLSGGEAQRVALARACLKDASLVLLDEPTAHLDAGTAGGIIETIAELSEGKTVLISTHNPDLAALCETTLRLEDGALKGSTNRVA
ncbi:MAG: thiol reductant ABC exporter subunit CydD [Rubrobacteraceae bacterium]